MPDNRRHRGAHPLDSRLFAATEVPQLREAVADFSWLLGRGYASKSALELVGNRFQLHERQRMAVLRSSCSDSARLERNKRQLSLTELEGKVLHFDGYNVLTITESALAGGVILHGRDGCFRDIASLHGNFRRVEETLPAIELLGSFTQSLGIEKVVWWLDSPVSNSGRLKTMLLETAHAQGWNWEAHTVFNPDAELKTVQEVVVSADSVILDAEIAWANLGRELIEQKIPQAWIIDLSEEANND